MRMYHRWMVSAIFCLAAVGAQADEVRLARQFGSNMVLQQGKPVRIWGWAKSGATVYDEQKLPLNSFSFPLEVK